MLYVYAYGIYMYFKKKLKGIFLSRDPGEEPSGRADDGSAAMRAVSSSR
jgi:hypothetical protein